MNKILSTRGIRRLSQPITRASSSSLDDQKLLYQLIWKNEILDPNSNIVTRWNYIFLLICVIALFIDPLYFLLPSVGSDHACLTADHCLLTSLTIFRSFADLFYILHIVIKFRTAFVSRRSRVFGRGELVRDPYEIAWKYIKSDFVIDFAATLPLPQIMNWFIIPNMKRTIADQTNYTLSLIVLIQYVPRFFLMFPLNKRIIKTTGVVAKTAWSGAAYNLLLYMLASHVLGSIWYTAAITRQYSCWRSQCNEEKKRFPACLPKYLDCSTIADVDRQYWLNNTNLVINCDPRNDDASFKFGMFAEAFTSGVGSSKFVRKYLYCLWFGLKNLSSYGQNLETTTFIGETVFAICVCIGGLFLFCLLIGNMQTYLQSLTIRVEEWRIKRRDTEEWMRHRQLPVCLQKRVGRFVQYNWLATRGVNEASILCSLPLDLRREVQRHLCLNLVRRVPFFSKMDEQLLDAICERLVATLSTQGTYIFIEDDPVDEMLFIIRGQLESSTTCGGRSGFFNSITLRPGDFCGEELLTWALLPNSNLNLPPSTRTVKALTEVEAFALGFEDLRFFSTQFKRLHSKALQDAFRYNSHQWRMWGACYIQSAWRRFRKRKMEKELALQETLSLTWCEDDNGTSYEGGCDNNIPPKHDSNKTQHLGATLLASEFATNTKNVHSAESSTKHDLKMPKLFKPDTPDFS
ncbi:cyclic nucleotide-gated ion channel 18 [Amaranthus tricolor]|uniref:cyclic nucleotide-gated ion channel 18 n=1 Tax=Amaranthus tricolor TaxID=29722 RepID=UPI002584B2D9|nr:cyclic nucleotide-gated ion channel 18 [Amaranthus tricolor]